MCAGLTNCNNVLNLVWCKTSDNEGVYNGDGMKNDIYVYQNHLSYEQESDWSIHAPTDLKGHSGMFR